MIVVLNRKEKLQTGKNVSRFERVKSEESLFRALNCGNSYLAYFPQRERFFFESTGEFPCLIRWTIPT